MPIAARFRAIVLTALVIASALAFYMVSLRVSTERSAVERLRSANAQMAGDIRRLHAELGTRARMPQLERWNASLLSLSAPRAVQYLDGAVELATFGMAPRPGMNAHVQQAVLNDQPAATGALPAQIHTLAAAPAPATAEIVTASYKPAPVAAPAKSALIHAVAYDPDGAAEGAGRLLSSAVMGEIRAAAQQEAKSFAKAGAR